MTYYSDGRITYHEAEKEVEKYIEDKSETKRYVTAREICRSQCIEPSQHNQHRILEALSEDYEKAKEWSTPQRFVIQQ